LPENYKQLADRAVQDVTFSSLKGTWGHDAIVRTSLEMAGAISGAQSATAVRINLHIERSAGKILESDSTPIIEDYVE
jgi:hypothetical protein